MLKTPLNHRPGLLLDILQMAPAQKALCINLVDILSARGSCGKPAVFSYDFQSSDGGSVTRRPSQLFQNGRSRQMSRRDLLGRKLFEKVAASCVRWRIEAFIDGISKLGGQ